MFNSILRCFIILKQVHLNSSRVETTSEYGRKLPKHVAELSECSSVS
jgi:hypothetical protein